MHLGPRPISGLRGQTQFFLPGAGPAAFPWWFHQHSRWAMCPPSAGQAEEQVFAQRRQPVSGRAIAPSLQQHRGSKNRVDCSQFSWVVSMMEASWWSCSQS